MAQSNILSAPKTRYGMLSDCRTCSSPESGYHSLMEQQHFSASRSAAIFSKCRLFWRVRQLAGQALWAYKLRSFFVIVAVSLGIASLTVIIAAMDGANKKADEITESFGPDAVFILGGDIINRAVGQRTLTLSWEDARRIRESVPGAYLVVPMRSAGSQLAKYRNRNYEVGRIIGATANYGSSWNWPLAEGRDFTDEDVARGARVCLIGTTPAQELFQGASPIGKTVFIKNIPFTVVGKLSHRGFAGGGGGDLDNRIIVPLTTLTQRFGLDRQFFRALRVKFHNPERMDDHVANLESLLRSLHGIRPGEPNDFTILTAGEVQKFLSIIKGGLVVFLGITAAAAIIVGGFVLANLFHLSVSERTTEVGLKKSLGAKNSAILVQFLIEAVLLTLIGAIVGIFMGLGMGQALSGFGLLEIELSWKIFTLALLSATAVGLIFGLRPAQRAARLAPIQALRGGE